MGLTRGLWVVQRINEATVAGVAPSLQGAPLQDRGPPLAVRPGTAGGGSGLRRYAYVDNLGVIGVCERAAGAAL